MHIPKDHRRMSTLYTSTEMKNLIDQVIADINCEAERIVAYIKHGLEWIGSDIYDVPLVIESTSLETIDKLYGRWGVYVFVMKEDFVLTREMVIDWAEVKGAPITNWHEYKLAKNQCFYLGSAVANGDSLLTRIKDHFGDREKTALRLSNSSRIVMKDKLKCFAFPIKKIYPKDQYDIILRRTEKKLHEAFEPVCGIRR